MKQSDTHALVHPIPIPIPYSYVGSDFAKTDIAGALPVRPGFSPK